MKSFTLVAFLTLLSFTLFAQDKDFESIEKFKSYRKKFKTKKVGNPFPLTEKFIASNNKEVDFGSFAKPTFIRLGFVGCHPCSFEMPAFVKLAKEYPNVDFIYVTFYNATDIKEHFDYIDYNQENLHFVQMDRDTIENNKLVIGYSSNWFIKKGNIVSHFSNGGRTSDIDVSYERFKKQVDALR